MSYEGQMFRSQLHQVNSLRGVLNIDSNYLSGFIEINYKTIGNLLRIATGRS